MIRYLFAGVLVFLASMCATALVRKYAVKAHLLDYPNQRSSHSQPTPRGGGISIALASLAAAIGLWAVGRIDPGLAAAFVGGGAATALIGFKDDRGSVSVAVRIAVHVLAASWAVYCLGGVPPIMIGEHLIDLGVIGDVLGVLALVWMLNLFNFMDGIDGLAASEAAFVTLSASGLAYWLRADPWLSAYVGVGSLGFVIWNWPPARIFMGDVGSGFLGYVIGVLAIASARENPVALFVWLILGCVFIVDATFTLVRRLARRERVYQAHRSHAYQWLARKWGSHARVTISVMSVNVVWLLPCAIVAALRPQRAALLLLVALAPVTIMAVFAGAGRAEHKIDS